MDRSGDIGFSVGVAGMLGGADCRLLGSQGRYRTFRRSQLCEL
jgi:hypothetical protein